MKLRRPEHPERIAIIAVVLLIVVNAAILGTRSEVRGAVVPERSPVILELSPQEGEDIVPQAPIVVDLNEKYTGQLTLDRHLIPDDQVSITHPNVFELMFQPGADHDITKFSPGPHEATIEFWPVGQDLRAGESAALAGHLLVELQRRLSNTSASISRSTLRSRPRRGSALRAVRPS